MDFPPSHPFTSNLSLSPAQKTSCPSPQQSNRLEIGAAAGLDDGGGPAALWGQGVLLAHEREVAELLAHEREVAELGRQIFHH